MRGPLLIASILLAVTLSGCLVDNEDAPGNGDGTSSGTDIVGSDSEGNPIKAGDDLGELTYEDDGQLNSAVTQPDCANTSGSTENHHWTIPARNADGISWKAATVTVTVTKSHQASDIDVQLIKGGTTLDHATETGPDEGTTITVSASDVTPGQLTIQVSACTSAYMLDYNVEGTADMIAAATASPASSEASGSSASSTGDVTVQEKTDGNGNTYYEASRQETYEATLTGDSGSADISSVGVIDYTAGGGSDYRLVATLKARGDSEQQARDRLAEMSVDHTAKDGNQVTLDVHGQPGGNGWSHKQIDMTFDAPKAIAWTSFDATSGGGIINVDGVTADSMDLRTGGGIVTVTDSTTDSLDVYSGGGIITVRDTRANDLDLDAGGGQVEAQMRKSTQSGAWDLSAGGGMIDLELVEASELGYTLDATNPGGSINFNFDDIEETSNNCNYGYCSNRKAETNGYSSRDIKVSVDLSIGGGIINAYS